ncbi:MAG: erythromycin esterase family protein [Anaerolineaceae bacterium]|nr:erythromycin esterase family protein [Anaerolineaceae bacterium]
MKKTKWMQKAIPLSSVTDTQDFSDLQGLKEVLANVRYIGLGESTHGTREFFQLKHRMLAFLVKEMGYRVFAIEAGSLPCQNINDYVLYGKGDRAAALTSQGYWTWDTEEVTDLIEWMRQHNLHCQRDEICQFIGYDIKPVDETYAQIRRLMPKAYFADEELARIAELLSKEQLNSAENVEAKEKILKLHGNVMLYDCEIRANIGQTGYDLLKHCTEMLWQDYSAMKALEGDAIDRDKFMAENIFQMVRSLPADTKVVIWAHNAHIAIDPVWKNMGYRLQEEFGDLYYPAALTFTRGSFQSRLMLKQERRHYEMGDLQEFEVGEPRQDFWENDLKTFSKGDYFLDFRALKKETSFRTWAMDQEMQMFGAGGGFVPFDDKPQGDDIFGKCALGKHFDGVFHIHETTRARPNPTGIRVKGQKSK